MINTDLNWGKSIVLNRVGLVCVNQVGRVVLFLVAVICQYCILRSGGFNWTDVRSVSSVGGKWGTGHNGTQDWNQIRFLSGDKKQFETQEYLNLIDFKTQDCNQCNCIFYMKNLQNKRMLITDLLNHKSIDTS